jgi:hypothetical protein
LAHASRGPKASEPLHLTDRGWNTLASLETNEAVQKVELLSGQPCMLRLLAHGNNNISIRSAGQVRMHPLAGPGRSR